MNQRGPQDRQPDEPGWWLASDGKWYPPESAPQPPTPQQPPESAPTVQQPQQPPGPVAPRQGTPTKWWDQTWFFVATLLFCFPVALVLLWRKPWSRGVKIGVTALVAVVFIAFAATSSASTNKQKSASPTPTTRATVPPTTAPPTTRATVPPTTRATVPPTTQPRAATDRGTHHAGTEAHGPARSG